ncbi:MAG: hypothetical protein LBB53_06200 [Prevotellaceae bacterium]|jgi:F0F1-type ATP synthase assembly protein I|nr:hypothetical protein [Prevotellaceae bacterium]
MYSEKLENLINHALADGVLTEKEKQVLFKNAEAEGIDLDEFEVILEAKLYEKQQEQLVQPENPDSAQSEKGKFANFMSSNPLITKLLICLVIAIVGFLVFKFIMSWILKVIICLLIFAVIAGAIYVGSNIVNKMGED